ncbi:MAG: OmpL47-type beta-barrel domain-containing protein [Ktedonobacterales bacterium]
MRRPLSVVLARLPFKRPFMIGIAALLLVGLVGAAVWWQVGAHASPATVNLSVVSDTSVAYSLVSGKSGTAVLTYGHTGCTALDNGVCTGGAWTQVQSAFPGAHWIWPTALWDPDSQGLLDPVTFSKEFSIPANALNTTGHIVIAADNYYYLQVNGQDVGNGQDWTHPNTYDLSPFLHTGTNIITARALNDPYDTDPDGNPAGLIFRADMSYTPGDSTAPTTTASLAGTLGSNGWYRGPVTVTLQAKDDDDASSTLLTNYSIDGGTTWLAYNSKSPLTFDTDGQLTLQFYSVDQAANPEATHSVPIKIDQTAPVLNVSTAANQSITANQSYDVCSTARPMRPTFAPADATSGLDGPQGDSWTPPTSATGAGVYTYTAHATDKAGNQASETQTYKVLYGAAYSGVLDPFQAGQTNSRTLGSTMPFKFQLLCNGTPITNAVASLSVKQGSGTAATTKPKKLSTTNTFTYNPTSQQYQLNVSTGAGYTNPDGSVVTFATGTWTFTVTLDDGVSYDYTIQLS